MGWGCEGGWGDGMLREVLRVDQGTAGGTTDLGMGGEWEGERGAAGGTTSRSGDRGGADVGMGVDTARGGARGCSGYCE